MQLVREHPLQKIAVLFPFFVIDYNPIPNQLKQDLCTGMYFHRFTSNKSCREQDKSVNRRGGAHILGTGPNAVFSQQRQWRRRPNHERIRKAYPASIFVRKPCFSLKESFPDFQPNRRRATNNSLLMFRVFWGMSKWSATYLFGLPEGKVLFLHPLAVATMERAIAISGVHVKRVNTVLVPVGCYDLWWSIVWWMSYAVCFLLIAWSAIMLADNLNLIANCLKNVQSTYWV